MTAKDSLPVLTVDKAVLKLKGSKMKLTNLKFISVNIGRIFISLSAVVILVGIVTTVISPSIGGFFGAILGKYASDLKCMICW